MNIKQEDAKHSRKATIPEKNIHIKVQMSLRYHFLAQAKNM